MRNGTVHLIKKQGNEPLPNAIAFRIKEVRMMGGPARTTIYKLAREGRLKLVKLGGRTLVEGDSVRNLLLNGY
jgi:predicted DNA-binding transcriptional regulator AlpA